MIQKTVYFRTQEDVDKFNALANKAEWLHEHLNDAEDGYSLQDFKDGKPQAELKAMSGVSDVFKGQPKKPRKTPEQRVHEVTKQVFIPVAEVAKGLCEHFQLKGECLTKGCKYGRGKS